MSAVVDLHVHSTASDGEVSPPAVVERAAAVGLAAVALTDHDTVAGIAAAAATGRQVGVRVIPGCEFSVAVWWGELHLLGYFVPLEHASLERFLERQRAARDARAREIVDRLTELGSPVEYAAVSRLADGAPIGRPHIARALVETGAVASVYEAFDRFLADGGPAATPRPLPRAEEVITLVRDAGGVTSAAHLKERSSRDNLVRLAEMGVDAVEVLHPAHDARAVRALDRLAGALGLLRTGGSDWHGRQNTARHQALGAMQVPARWADELEALHRARIEAPRG